MIQNPVVPGGGVTMDELFFGKEGTVSVSVKGYKALLVLYSNYKGGASFMQVGHVPIDIAISEGSDLSIGYNGSGAKFLTANYSGGTVEISANNTMNTIYAVYGIKQ